MFHTVFSLILLMVATSISAAQLQPSATPLVNAKADINNVTQNKPVLLQFWASWCHSCGTIFWDMDKLVSQHGHVGYAAISIDEQWSDASQYLNKHTLATKYQNHFFFDAGQHMARHFQVESVPTIILLDANHNVCLRTSGHLNSDDLFKLSQAMKTIHQTSC